MELPFAFESPVPRNSVLCDDSSLVTASSQGSFLSSDDADPILIATPAAVERNRMASVLSQFGVNSSEGSSHNAGEAATGSPAEEIIDFTYVNVWDTPNQPSDVVLAADKPKRDILSLLFNGTNNEELAGFVEQANEAASVAEEAKHNGALQQALDAHTTAAKFFRDAAIATKSQNGMFCRDALLVYST